MVVNSQDTELWLPPGVAHSQTLPVGRNAETGGLIYEYIFRVHDEVTGRKSDFRVIVDDTMSMAHIEEMVGNAFESWLIDVRLRHSKPAPTQAQKKEIGKILNDIRINRDKRKLSSNNKIYYNGLQ